MTLNHDLFCGRCRYDLFATPLEGHCPECGVPVARSISGEKLAAADRRWRMNLSLGLGAISAGIAIWIGLQVVVGQGFSPGRLTQYIVMAALVFLATGMWLFTDPEPDPLVAERTWSRRKILRAGWLIVWILYLVAPLIGVRATLFTAEFTGGKFLVLSTFALAIAMFFLLGLHMAALMQRAGRKMFARIWRIIAGASVLLGVVLITPVAARFVHQLDIAANPIATLVILAAGFALVTTLGGLLGYAAWIIWRIDRRKTQP